MFILFKDIQQVSPIFDQVAAQDLYGFMSRMRRAALENSYSWSGYGTLQQYASVCFWAMRKMEYGFVANHFDVLEKQLNRPLRILDAGCGVVPLNNWLASRGHQVIAFDPLRPDIEFLVKNNLNDFYETDVRYLTAKGEHLPFPSQWFDVVTFVSVLEHTIPGNDQLIMNEFARVLRPNGHLFMTFDVTPPRPTQEGEDERFQHLRRYGYPFTPESAQKIIGSLKSFFMVNVVDIPPELYDLQWEDVHTFWRSTQIDDNREQEKREYLAMGVAIQRNQQSYHSTNDDVLSAYRNGQTALEEQLNFYHYHAENRYAVIQDIQKQVSEKENLIIDLDEDLKKRENLIINLDEDLKKKEDELKKRADIIGNFQNNIPYWFANGPTRRFYLLGPAIRYLRYLRGFFLSKLGVLAQHPPKPLEIPVGYHQNQVTTQEAPIISMATPSYNQAEFIGKTIRSVLEQGYANLEYVVQDGNSTDRTMEILEPYKKDLKHFESRSDNGQAHAINLGFQHTGGEIMAYLNSDDVLLPGALNFVADYFSKHPDVDAIYSHRVVIDENDQEIGRWLMPRHDDQVIYWADYVPQETLFWRRRIWEKSGGRIDESYNFALDWDLLLRFQQSGAVIHRVPRFLAAFRVHGAQKTSAHINEVGAQEMQRIRERYLGRRVTNEEVFKHIRGYLNQSIIYHKLYRLGIYKS